MLIQKLIYRRRIFSDVLLLIVGVSLGATLCAKAQNAPRAADRRGTQPQQRSTPPAQTTSAAQGQSTSQDDDEVISVETQLVNLLFTALDRSGRFVTTLRQEDIRVLEDGRPQNIFTFARQTDLPLALAILVDTSISQARTLSEEKRAAQSFLDAILRPEQDQTAVVSFTGKALLDQKLTPDVESARAAINRLNVVLPPDDSGVNRNTRAADDAPENSTAIFDAVWTTCENVLAASPARGTRRAIILLSDGADSGSQNTLREAVEQAVRTETIIYAIGIGDEQNYGDVEKGTLRRLAERTGGKAFFPKREGDLQIAFDQIRDELRAQYLVAYSSSNQSSSAAFRRLRIELANPALRRQGLQLTYRQGYYPKNLR